MHCVQKLSYFGIFCWLNSHNLFLFQEDIPFFKLFDVCLVKTREVVFSDNKEVGPKRIKRSEVIANRRASFNSSIRWTYSSG